MDDSQRIDLPHTIPPTQVVRDAGAPFTFVNVESVGVTGGPLPYNSPL